MNFYFSIGGNDSTFIEVFEMLNDICDNDDYDDDDIKEHSLKKKYMLIENNELFYCNICFHDYKHDYYKCKLVQSVCSHRAHTI
jgi:hypothetical protein